MAVVEPVTSLGRTGLYDWLAQRASAVILLVYSGVLGFILLSSPQLDYARWQALFASIGMKSFTLLALLALIVHAWVGVWTVSTDYLTPRMLGRAGTPLRLAAQAASGVLFFVYLLWGIHILWRVAS